ncbi:queuosine precursor transporter [Treponema sp. OMZ 792]|uniref:queuosine precursor transporter n=1 Tax=unclassified Treponema TaxID=2638727 RepID=UPI0020A478A2|nr:MULTISPECIES: queuosine precursor transporter [unclassified Treponema]UTC75441.1 queuosine precursor transporter [Treponema sp. OMZ 792]UTC78770.1 queuosine precursor transporter [Treponema sp. OMZ 799]UTC79443.1 queuosine precursor transporter [Treponema sp. OMZ 798]
MENTQLTQGVNENDPIKKTNFLPVISGLFVGVLVLSNILAAKMVQLGPFVFDGGTLLFPFSYIFGDVLAEVYGYRASRKVIWTGFFMLLLMSLNIRLISVLPAEAEWIFQKDFENILLQMPRISAGSLCGYFIGEYSNSVVLSKLKVATKGKYLWLRTIGSTLVGQLLDSIVFVVIAFLGLYSLNVLIIMIFSNYLFKTFIEVIFTPLTYKVISFVKKHEQIDVYDYNVSYNPLPGK